MTEIITYEVELGPIGGQPEVVLTTDDKAEARGRFDGLLGYVSERGGRVALIRQRAGDRLIERLCVDEFSCCAPCVWRSSGP